MAVNFHAAQAEERIVVVCWLQKCEVSEIIQLLKSEIQPMCTCCRTVRLSYTVLTFECTRILLHTGCEEPPKPRFPSHVLQPLVIHNSRLLGKKVSETRIRFLIDRRRARHTWLKQKYSVHRATCWKNSALRGFFSYVCAQQGAKREGQSLSIDWCPQCLAVHNERSR